MIEPHDFGGVFLGSRLVGPVAGLELALDVDLRALAQVFLGDVGEALVENDDPVPFGALAGLAGRLVLPALGSGDRKIDHLVAALGRAALRIAAQIAHQNHLVDAACHGICS